MTTTPPMQEAFPLEPFRPRTAAAWIVALLPAVLACVAVFFESSDFFSAEHTGSFLYPLVCKYITYVDPARWDVIHYLIRKCGHLTGFAIVGQCFYFTTTHLFTRIGREPHRVWQRRCALWALLLAFLLASSDEIHQSFIPSRTAAFHDVVIDVIGAWLGMIARFGLAVFFRPRSGVKDRQQAH